MRAKQAVRSKQCGESKRLSSGKRANGRVSGPVFMPGFLVILDHCAIVHQPEKSDGEGGGVEKEKEDEGKE